MASSRTQFTTWAMTQSMTWAMTWAMRLSVKLARRLSVTHDTQTPWELLSSSRIAR
jgi:hypothetical protein